MCKCGSIVCALWWLEQKGQILRRRIIMKIIRNEFHLAISILVYIQVDIHVCIRVAGLLECFFFCFLHQNLEFESWMLIWTLQIVGFHFFFLVIRRRCEYALVQFRRYIGKHQCSPASNCPHCIIILNNVTQSEIYKCFICTFVNVVSCSVTHCPCSVSAYSWITWTLEGRKKKIETNFFHSTRSNDIKFSFFFHYELLIVFEEQKLSDCLRLVTIDLAGIPHSRIMIKGRTIH